MSKMKYGRNVRIDLEKDIISLKKQLSMTQGENHLLKVKIRRLENELRKKDKFMNFFLINSEKHIESQNLVYKRTSNTILKLKKENEELKEFLLLKRDYNLKNPYRTKMNSISHDQIEPNKMKNYSTKSQHNILSRLESVSDSHTLNKNENKQKSFLLTSKSAEGSRECINNFLFTRADADKLIEMINVLKRQQDIDKDILRVKNLEITQLAAELKDLKNQLKAEKKLALKRLNSSNTKPSSPKSIKNSLEINKTVKSRNKRQKSPSTDEKKKLEPVYELNENESSDASHESDIKSNINKINTKRKTPIEYLIDSEVSSDGEEIYYVNT